MGTGCAHYTLTLFNVQYLNTFLYFCKYNINLIRDIYFCNSPPTPTIHRHPISHNSIIIESLSKPHHRIIRILLNRMHIFIRDKLDNSYTVCSTVLIVILTILLNALLLLGFTNILHQLLCQFL
jgi:hypothetical protein